MPTLWFSDPFVVDAGAPVMDIRIGTGLFRTMSLRGQ